MNTALFIKSDFLGPLQGLMRWWSTSRVPAIGVALPEREVPLFTPKSIAANDQLAGAIGHNRLAPKPLRVLRVVEIGQSGASGGRMLISGRMADVCAELDRLAAREAALS